MSFFNLRSKLKAAVKPGQSIQKQLFLCEPFASSALVEGNFQPLVQLPSLIDKDEWLAAHGTFFLTQSI